MDIKSKIKLIHKGRGNSWLKVVNTSEVYQRVISKISNLDSSNIISFFEKEGFAWIRFSKVNKDNTARYEVRYRGSKLDHPDCTINLTYEEIKSLNLLGNTPVKLFLETNESKKNIVKKLKSVNIKVNGNKNLERESIVNNHEVVAEVDYNTIKDVKPKRTSKQELEMWFKWCKLNDIDIED